MTDTGSGDNSSRPEEIDLSGVAPLRRAETRRRIEAIRAYLNIPSPSRADRVVHAQSLGIGVQQFMLLVKAWLEHGEAVATGKAGANAGAARGVRRRGLPPETRAAAESALRALPTSASHREAIAAVQEACRSQQTRPPSNSMVSYLRMGLRGTANGGPRLLVGRATASMPIIIGDALSLPEVALAVEERSGTIRAAAIIDCTTGRPPEWFEGEVKRAVKEVDGPVTIGIDDDVIVAAVPDPQVVSRFKAGRMLAKAIGRNVGGVRLTYGPLASRDPKRALRAKEDEPLDMAEAVTVLSAEVVAHNASRTSFPVKGRHEQAAVT